VALIAERFLSDDDGVIDLATGEPIRLSIDSAPSVARPRVALCDRLFAVRHPLLLPVVDYGAFGDHWFEAHADHPALRVPEGQARTAALHLVRFLRAHAIELDGAAASRHVRAALEGPRATWRPIGLALQPRAALETIRTVLETHGPPGVTAITVHAPQGSGLRTARLYLARAARQAGYLVIDSRFGALAEALDPPRHLCVFDWLPGGSNLPPVLAFADTRGGRRHAWIRFCRHPVAGAGSIGLEPLMTRDLITAVYLDAELGPTAGDVRRAVAACLGNASTFVQLLSAESPGMRVQPSWVHETAPEYRVTVASPPVRTDATDAGVTRLCRAVEAAVALASNGRHARAARVLARCGPALAARGALAPASSAALALGELHVRRGKLTDAAAAFERARRWCPDATCAARASLGDGEVLLEQGRFHEAEGALRTAMVCGVEPYASHARRAIADLLVLRGRLDAAEEMLAGTAASTTLVVLRRRQGDLASAARLAPEAIAAAREGGPADLCAAHLAASRVHAALADREAVRRQNEAAHAAARASRQPILRIWAAAEASACLDVVGLRTPAPERERLLRAARRLPPLAAARVRIALKAATSADRSLLDTPADTTDLIQRFRDLLTVIHDAPDEASALQLIAADVLRTSEACSVVIRSAGLGRQVAEAGRPWPGEESLTQSVLRGGGSVLRDGLTPDAAEPVLAGGSILGAIAVRWTAGCRPPPGRVRDLLRTAAVGAAPMLKALNTPRINDPAADAAAFPDDLLGQGPAAVRVRDAIRRAALAPYPVLIEGESGSGKELVARAIHARSNRRGRKFCPVNCAAFSDDLLEAELFGHARGAFTGAVGERAGLFEEADQGTIFLDEVAELSGRAQAKLLRVLQEGEIRRVGENLPRKIDARVVAATNKSLEREVESDRFRADLRFRLDVIRIPVPALRDRADDVPWLAQRIWNEAALRVGTRATLGDDVLVALARYSWPGNVRELQNVIASLAVHGPRRGRLPASLLPAHIACAMEPTGTAFDDARAEFERRFVSAALARAAGSRKTAATELGISRQGLLKIIKRLGLEGM